MRRSFQAGKIWTRQLHREVAASAVQAEAGCRRQVDLDEFRQRAFAPQKPFLFRRDAASPGRGLPAARKWFSSDDEATFSPYMNAFHEWPFPYELVRPSSGAAGHDAITGFRDWLLASRDVADRALSDMLSHAVAQLSTEQRFFHLYSPLSLLIRALEFNRSQGPGAPGPVQLYVAQSLLTDLPQALQEDVPIPDLVRKAGRGDVYSSSIWLGTEPTYTPLHRDPNPNLFCQLCSSKVVRLLPPALGDRLFSEVQAQIRQHGSSRIRTTAMMEGKEREVLHDAVWQSDSLLGELYEAELVAGDALFIPKGWWHSVKSKGSGGQLNGSANWWFR